VNENFLQRIWARSSACLLVSPVAFVLGGVLLFGAVDESSGREPRGWLLIGLTVLGMGLFGLGATTWARALCLVSRQMRARRGAA
jgi:hypothetical protein